MVPIQEEKITVKLPNMFVSFLVDEPPLNQHYKEVRNTSEEAVNRECELTGRVAKAVIACDFGYFAAIMAPHASRSTFRIICDWGNWIFPFDDLFDDGPMRADPTGTRKAIDLLLSDFQQPPSPSASSNHSDKAGIVPPVNKPPIIRFHEHIWEHIRAHATPGAAARYEEGMTAYARGALEQVEHFSAKSVPPVSVMLAQRRGSICASTLFALIEYGHELDVPDYVFRCETMQAIQTIGIDLTLMHNDLISYRKEESEGVPHNLVAAARMHGLGAQEAIDLIGGMVDERVRQFEVEIARLPRWGKDVDEQVARYVEAVRDTVRANLWWSFVSGRMLTKDEIKRVKETGEIDILMKPPWLEEEDVKSTKKHISLEYVGRICLVAWAMTKKFVSKMLCGVRPRKR